MKYMGFAVGKVSTFAKLGWQALLAGGGRIVLLASTFITWLGGLSIFASMGAAASAALPFLLVGLLITGVAVSAIWIVDYMMKKYLGFGIAEATYRGGELKAIRLEEASRKLYDPRNVGDLVIGLFSLLSEMPGAGMGSFATGAGSKAMDIKEERDFAKAEALEAAP
jgi:hypothetical protein